MTADVIVCHLGARRHYAEARMLATHHRLAWFCTDICATTGWTSPLSRLPACIGPAALRRLAGRVPEGVPPGRIVSFPLFGLHSAVVRSFGHDETDVIRHAIWAGQRFSQLVARRGFNGAQGLYTISGEGLEMIRVAKAEGLWVAVDQINAPHELLERLVEKERQRFPGWSSRQPTSVTVAQSFADRERAEWELADVIVCPSEFVRDGIDAVGGPVEKCVVVPSGVNGEITSNTGSRAPGPLRVLTAGAVGLRKGSPYVMEAAERMKEKAEFRMVGPVNLPEAPLKRLRATIEVLGVVPRNAMAAQYKWADVFLLPSTCEGSAMVVYEALAAGLPVVVTPNTGSVVTDGKDGFTVPQGDSGAIVECLERLLTDPELRHRMSEVARQTAENHTVARYGERLLAALPG
ncbi:glycosyltransferase family 4 protein [Qingshengfaniella alkalisoli]|uniref:Glycosyltransferase family 4 protein n=1 Tax=Qingshengfaniella alkalisoli TaxID=2599296 RepID=A0A5B8I9D7_9RHOB|nr:glycosyltransferase family 4 protein [Qingshengfaniella alkalisoli]QDY70479.1 glycosyltransferase family 4 protein [Qingshengfaniella alkalisoli]